MDHIFMAPGFTKINAVVLGSNEWISIFCWLALIVDFFLQNFQLFQGISINNCYIYWIILPIIKAMGDTDFNNAVSGSYPPLVLFTD